MARRRYQAVADSQLSLPLKAASTHSQLLLHLKTTDLGESEKKRGENPFRILPSRYNAGTSPCDGPRASYCGAACCYLPFKEVTPDEARELKRTISDGAHWYLKTNPESGGCVYLNKDNTCTIYDNRPRVCRAYDARDCAGDTRLERFIALIDNYQNGNSFRRKKVVADLRATAIEAFPEIPPEEAYEHLSPEV